MTYDPEQHGALCSKCPLRAAGEVPIAPRVSLASAFEPIAMVLDSPSQHDEKTRQPMSGPADSKLLDITYNVITKKNIALITTAVLCRFRTPGFEGRRKYDIKTWMAWWRKENRLRKRAKVPEMANPFVCCHPRLEAELQAAEARCDARGLRLAIMPMGTFALASVEGEPGKMKSIAKYRGSVIEPEEKTDAQ